jgi:hypothetical protein
MRNIKYPMTYTEQDILEAVRLVMKEQCSCASTCQVINDKKLNPVPRMTLNNYLQKNNPNKAMYVDSPQAYLL